MEKKDYKHEFTIKIEGNEWEEAINKAFAKRNKTAKIDGFRPGHAPKDVFIKKYGKESLYFDASDTLVQSAYLKVLENEKVIPVVEPKIDIKSINETGVEFVFTIITKPSVKINKYKNLGVKMSDTKVSDKELEEEFKHLKDRYTELVVKDGILANNDTAIIDFEGFKNGVAFEGGKGTNYSLEIGSNTFIPGFEEQLIGMKKDEEKEIEVTFPKDYGSKDLADAKATFKVKLNEIKEKKERELDKEFFEDLGMEGVNSKETLFDSLRESIGAKKKTDAENKYIDDLLDAVSKNTEVDLPEEMIDDEIHRLMHRFEEQLRMQGASLDLYYQFTKSTEEDLHKSLEKEAEKNTLYRLILEELVKIENVEITDEEANTEADKLASNYKMDKEELLKEFGGIEMIKYDLEVRKVFDKLKEYNK